jgi:ABC-2 type transport system permease protein
MRAIRKPPRRRHPLFGIKAVFWKEIKNILRDPWSIYFSIAVTVTHLLLIGFGVNTKVTQISTVIIDQSQTQDSRRFIQQLVNTDDFKIVKITGSDRELYRMLVAGEAKVGIKIPGDYSAQLMEGAAANVLVLADGSNSAVASEVINVTNGLTLRESLKSLPAVAAIDRALPLEARQSVLFNPDTRTSNFTIPGLIPFEIELLICFLISTAMVKERENGTIEQLFLTPIRPLGLMIGKMVPYGIFALCLEAEMLILSHLLFDLPMNGSYALLFLLSVPFILTVLGVGLLISVKISTVLSSAQVSVGFTLISIFISGYLFDLDSMPRFFQLFAELLPTTHFIRITRGIMLRGADFQYLWVDTLWLLVMGVTLILVSARLFQRKID